MELFFNQFVFYKLKTNWNTKFTFKIQSRFIKIRKKIL